MTHSPLPTALPAPRFRLGGTTFALALLASTSLAAAQSAEEIVRDWLEDMRAGGASVETAGITYSRGSDTLEVRGLSIVPSKGDAKAGGSIKVPSISFVGLARPAGGGLVARSMAVPTVEAGADDGTARIVVTGIEASEIALPSFAGLGYDSAEPFRSQIKVLKTFLDAKAERIRLGRVEMNLVTPDAPVAIGYDGITVTGLGGGRIERIVSGAATVTGRGKDRATGKEVAIDMRAGKAEVVGYDFGAYLKVVDDDAYVGGRGDGVWREMQKSASLDGLSMTVGPISFSIARAALGAVRVRQADAPVGALIDRALVDPKSFEKDPKAALRMSFGLLGAFALESYVLDGWSISGPELDRFLLGRFALRNLSGDGLGEFSLDGIDAAAKGGSFRLARFALGDVRFPSLAAVEAAVGSAETGAEVDPMAVMPTLGFLRLDGAEVDVPGKGRVALGGLSLDLAQYIKAVPTSLRLVLRNLVAPAALVDDRKGREALATLGYDRIDYSGEVSMRWDEPTGEFRIDTISSSIADAGTLALNATFGNVPRALFEDPKTADRHLVGLLLKGIGISYRDASLAERLLKLASAQTRQTPEALRNTALGFLPQILAEVKDPGRRQRIGDALTAFVKAPKSIVIASELTSPVPVMQLVGSGMTAPQGLPDLLRLEATANR